jgi:hypothetical protein
MTTVLFITQYKDYDDTASTHWDQTYHRPLCSLL